MKSIDPHKVSDYIRDVSESIITPRFQNLADHEIDTKTGPKDLVTIADREAETELGRIFSDLLPGSIVVGEESVSEGAAKVSSIVEQDEPVWVIDPVDGTRNFAQGRPVFGCMVALTHKGQTLQSWIYDIPGDRMGMAETGAGCEIGGQRKVISAKDPGIPFSEMQAYIAIGFIPESLRSKIRPLLKEFKEASALQCCAHEYLGLVEGERDFSFYKRMKPWDHLPGLLLYQEAGGYSRSWSGEVHRPENEQSGIINAPDKILWQRLHGLLLPPEVQHLVQG